MEKREGESDDKKDKKKKEEWDILGIVGAQGSRMKLKGRSIGVGMLQATGSRKKAARGRKEMN